MPYVSSHRPYPIWFMRDDIRFNQVTGDAPVYVNAVELNEDPEDAMPIVVRISPMRENDVLPTIIADYEYARGAWRYADGEAVDPSFGLILEEAMWDVCDQLHEWYRADARMGDPYP